MSTYTLRYNRTSIHIDGLSIRTKSDGKDVGGHVSYYAENACGALSRSGSKMAVSTTSDDVAAILKAARSKAIAIGNKLCKTCEAAAEAMIAELTEEIFVPEIKPPVRIPAGKILCDVCDELVGYSFKEIEAHRVGCKF